MNLTTSGTLFPGIFEGNLQILAVYGSDTGLFFDQLDVSNSFFSNLYTTQKMKFSIKDFFSKSH